VGDVKGEQQHAASSTFADSRTSSIIASGAAGAASNALLAALVPGSARRAVTARGGRHCLRINHIREGSVIVEFTIMPLGDEEGAGAEGAEDPASPGRPAERRAPVALAKLLEDMAADENSALRQVPQPPAPPRPLRPFVPRHGLASCAPHDLAP